MDEQRQQAEANLSADLVRHLQSQGMTLRQIGEGMGLSESFISRVAHRQRSLTMEHLLRLQEATGTPLLRGGRLAGPGNANPSSTAASLS